MYESIIRQSANDFIGSFAILADEGTSGVEIIAPDDQTTIPTPVPQSNTSENATTNVNSDLRRRKWRKKAEYLLVCIMLILSIIYLYLKPIPLMQDPQIPEQCTFIELSEQYPEQAEHLWYALSTGIGHFAMDQIEKPCVHLFLNDNWREMNDLVKSIVRYTSLCFDPHLEPVFFRQSDFNVTNCGRTIKKYNSSLSNIKRVIITAKLDDFNKNAVDTLHIFSTIYNRTVRRVIIFLIPKASTETEIPSELVEGFLNEMCS